MPDWGAIRQSILPDGSESILPPSIKLPVLPRAFMEFSEKAQDPDVDTSELGRIIATDSGLCSELLRHVNSAHVGAQCKVTTTRQAIVMLGIRATQSYLATNTIKRAMKSSSSKLINFQNFWNTNLERSLFAREVAKLLGADDDVAFTAGMLQDFLLPMITNQLFEKYLEFSENRREYTSLTAFERQHLGWDHATAAGQLMYAWKFPDELICCVCLHHHGTELLKDKELGETSAAAAAVSSLLPDALRQEARGLEMLVELENEWEAFRLIQLAHKVDEEFTAMTTNAKNHFSFLRICEKYLAKVPDRVPAGQE